MFKDRIKEARKAAGLSQEQLGRILGISKQTISDYERGYSEPDMAKVTSLMSALSIDANYLWQDEMKTTNAESDVSARAMEIAKAYDKMSEYGKRIIDKVVESEQQFKMVKIVPVVGIAYQDGTVETKFAAKMEQRELAQEETPLPPSRILR